MTESNDPKKPLSLEDCGYLAIKLRRDSKMVINDEIEIFLSSHNVLNWAGIVIKAPKHMRIRREPIDTSAKKFS